MNWLRGDLLVWLALVLPLTALSLWAASRAAARRAACFGARADDLAPRFSRARRLVRDVSPHSLRATKRQLAEDAVRTDPG